MFQPLMGMRMRGDGEEAVVALPRLALLLLLDLQHADQAGRRHATRRHGGVEEQQHVERIAVLAQGRREETEVVGKGQGQTPIKGRSSTSAFGPISDTGRSGQF